MSVTGNIARGIDVAVVRAASRAARNLGSREGGTTPMLETRGLNDAIRGAVHSGMSPHQVEGVIRAWTRWRKGGRYSPIGSRAADFADSVDAGVMTHAERKFARAAGTDSHWFGSDLNVAKLPPGSLTHKVARTRADKQARKVHADKVVGDFISKWGRK